MKPQKTEGTVIIGIGMTPAPAEYTVPLDPLTLGDVSPQIGDEVEFTVKGKIKEAKDGIALVKPMEINGQAFMLPEPKKEKTKADEEEELMAAASEADSNINPEEEDYA